MSEADHNEAARHGEEYELPAPSFETLVRSIVTQVQFALLSFEGEGGRHDPDLPAARHYIDLLGMLQEKTRGNLSLEEERLLGNSLTELRFRYVQVLEETRKRPAGSGPGAATESAQA